AVRARSANWSGSCCSPFGPCGRMQPACGSRAGGSVKRAARKECGKRGSGSFTQRWSGTASWPDFKASAYQCFDLLAEPIVAEGFVLAGVVTQLAFRALIESLSEQGTIGDQPVGRLARKGDVVGVRRDRRVTRAKGI